MGLWDTIKDVAGVVTAPISAGLDYLTSSSNNDLQKSVSKKNLKYQKEFAQHGIRWKVDDAIAAGLNPLAALGAQTNSFTPTQVFPEKPNWAGHGQNIQRAINAKTTATEREISSEALTQARLTTERMRLENHGLRNDLNNSRGGNIPPMPDVPSHGDYPITDIKPSNVIVEPSRTPASRTGGIEASAHPGEQWVNYKGTYRLLPSRDVAERLESSPVDNVIIGTKKVLDYINRNTARLHVPQVRARMEKTLKDLRRTLNPAGKGYIWTYNHKDMSWVRVKSNDKNRIWLHPPYGNIKKAWKSINRPTKNIRHPWGMGP